MVNPKKKGNKFEREIANFLTKILGVKFHRVPMSGAFATVNKTTSEVFNGDVFTEDEKYKDIVIECKSYKSFSINDFFSDKSKFYSWINQSVRESGNKNWVLFFKINNIGTFFLIDYKFMRDDNFNSFVEKIREYKKHDPTLSFFPSYSVNMIKT